jgi:hypothetical protein
LIVALHQQRKKKINSTKLKAMKTVAQRLYDLIEDQEENWLDAGNGITISAPDEELLQATFSFVDTDETCLSVIFECEKSAFVQHLGITRLPDIYQLTSNKLMDLYNEGLAEIWCIVTLDRAYTSIYQKTGDETVLENDGCIKHTIPLHEKLETPDQFIAYTIKCCKLMEYSIYQRN